MSAIVTCACGQSFRASARIQGKTVACPKCRQPLFVPAAEELEVLAPAEPDPPPAPYNPYANPDAFAASAYPAPGYNAAPPLSSLPPAPKPADEAAPDMRIVLWAGLAAGGVLMCLITAITVSRLIARPDGATASATPTTATPQTAAPKVTSTPAPKPAKSASTSWLPSFSFNSGVRSVINDRFEIYAPVELGTGPALMPGMSAMHRGALTDKNGVAKAEYVVLLFPNPGRMQTIDRAEAQMTSRMHLDGKVDVKRVTVNGRPALHMTGAQGGSRVLAIAQFFDDEALIILVLAKADSSDVGNSAMDKYLYSFKKIK